MLDGRVIRGIDLNAQSFRNAFNKLPSDAQKQALERIKVLMGLPLDEIPAGFHFHQLKNRQVNSRVDPKTKVNAWTFHLTADDKWKASFTYESGTLYFRICGEHSIDKNP